MDEVKDTARMQRRGIERRKAILLAAEQILAEEGYDATTLKAVSDRVGIPTASMYHYFTDRHEIELELLRQHLPRLGKRVDDALSGAALQTLADIIDAVINPMVYYLEKNPACAELWFIGRHQALAELVKAFDEAKAKQVMHVLLQRGVIAKDAPLLAVQVAFEAGSRLFDVAFRCPPKEREVILTEARRLILAYLGTYTA